jgi:hypothetical protein
MITTPSDEVVPNYGKGHPIMETTIPKDSQLSLL